MKPLRPHRPSPREHQSSGFLEPERSTCANLRSTIPPCISSSTLMVPPISRTPAGRASHRHSESQHLLRSPGRPHLRRARLVDYDNRAAAFDSQNRHQPLDFQANDLSLLLSYIPAATAPLKPIASRPGATDLSLARGVEISKTKSPPKPVHGYFQATLDLTRSSATLNSLRLVSRAVDGASHTLDFSGALQNFNHPQWQARAVGDFDMRLLDPVIGYPFAPEGIAHLDLNGAGQAGEFRADGNVHMDNGSYIGTGVVATGLRLQRTCAC